MSIAAAVAPSLPEPGPSVGWSLLLSALLAGVAPTLLAYNLPPSATLLNQCVAVAVWGGWVMVLAPAVVPRACWPLLAALAVMALAIAASFTVGALPASLGLAALGLVAGAALLAVAGAAAAQRADLPAVFAAFCAGLLAAGVLSAGVALVQVFAPGWADGDWIAASGLPGRAVGNLRQPNHLCSLLLWAIVAAVALHELKRLPRALLAPLVVLLVVAVELTASRTGAVGLLLLLAWGLLDRRLSPTARALLVATPLLYGLSYGAMALYGDMSHQALGAEARLENGGIGEGASPNSRLNIWRNAWALALAHPWTGVGFGEFNLAWSLTPFAGRPIAFFDHCHNLELQLAAELGLPLAALVLGLLAWALVQAARRAWAAVGEAGTAARAALVLVLLAGWHSQVEYPLWYAYFLLPTAFAWGLALALPESSTATRRWSPGRTAALGPLVGAAAGLVLAVGGALAVLDYWRVVVIYAPPAGGVSLESRIQAGQRSVFFAHHADYAAATNDTPPAAQALGFARAPHSLMDTRLMVAWAQHLDRDGHGELARALAARLREFHNPDAQAFFAPCEVGAAGLAGAPTAAAGDFQCQAPQDAHDWREFLVAARSR